MECKSLPHTSSLTSQARVLMLLAFWVSFMNSSGTAPVDESGLVWPRYTGDGGSIVVFGDEEGKASQVVEASVVDEVFPRDEC